jgi:hypothetical protein
MAGSLPIVRYLAGIWAVCGGLQGGFVVDLLQLAVSFPDVVRLAWPDERQSARV